MEYVATVYGATAGGSPVWRVVSDGLHVSYVAIPYRHSSDAEVATIIPHALAARARPTKPLR